MMKTIEVTRINDDGTVEKITAAEVGVIYSASCKDCPARAKCKERQGR